MVPLFGLFGLAQSAAAATDLTPMQKRFGQLSDTDLDAYRFACTQCLWPFGTLTRSLSRYVRLIKYADPDDKARQSDSQTAPSIFDVIRVEVVSFDKAGRFKACDDALSAVARARDLLQKETSTATFQKEAVTWSFLCMPRGVQHRREPGELLRAHPKGQNLC